MKQALERIIELVSRIDQRSSSLDVEATLRTIAQTALLALEQQAPPPSSPLAAPRLIPIVMPRSEAV